jgi:hypothetical protein
VFPTGPKSAIWSPMACSLFRFKCNQYYLPQSQFKIAMLAPLCILIESEEWIWEASSAR